jgi:hypothetical protein
MKKLLNAKRLLFVVLFVSIFILFSHVIGARGQGQSISMPNTMTATATATATEAPSSQHQIDQLLKTYTEVLNVSQSAVEEVHTTTNKILDWVGILFSALTITGLGGAALLSWFGKNASDKANVAQQKAVEALDIIQKTEIRTTDLEKRNNLAIISSNELTQKQNYLLSQIDTAEKLLHSLQAEISQLKSSGEKDRQVNKKPLTLVQIDEFGMQALSGSPIERDSATLSLIEMSTRSDAVVRRRVAKALGILDDYDEKVAMRLKEMAESDHAKGVRKEAEKSLKLIEAKKPKKTTRRKS